MMCVIVGQPCCTPRRPPLSAGTRPARQLELRGIIVAKLVREDGALFSMVASAGDPVITHVAKFGGARFPAAADDVRRVALSIAVHPAATRCIAIAEASIARTRSALAVAVEQSLRAQATCTRGRAVPQILRWHAADRLRRAADIEAGPLGRTACVVDADVLRVATDARTAGGGATRCAAAGGPPACLATAAALWLGGRPSAAEQRQQAAGRAAHQPMEDAAAGRRGGECPGELIEALMIHDPPFPDPSSPRPCRLGFPHRRQ